MKEAQQKKAPLWIRVLEWLVVAVVLLVVVCYLWIQFEELDASVLHFRPLPIFLSLGVGTASGLLAALVVGGIFRSLGHPIGARAALVLATLPRLGKYLPGKVHAVLGLVWIAHRLRQVPARLSFSAAALLSVQVVAVSMISGALLVPFTSLAWPWILALLASALAGLAVLHPFLCLGPISWLFRRLNHPPLERSIGYFRALALASIAVAQKLVVAGMFALLASGLLELSPGVEGQLALSYVLATLLGFVAFFAPAGIGVQEGAMLLLLAPAMPADQAAMLTVAARIWQTAIILLDAGIGALFLLARDHGRQSLDST